MTTLYRDGVRHLMYCGLDGLREVHRYTEGEMNEIFTELQRRFLIETGWCDGSPASGIWIDLIFAGEAALAEALQ